MESIGGEIAFMAASAGKAFLILMEPHRLVFLGLGCIMGLVLGIIPGIGGLTGTAMLLPFTFNMDPYSAFAMLLGLGATTATGDPIPAVLFGVPGGAASAGAGDYIVRTSPDCPAVFVAGGLASIGGIVYATVAHSRRLRRILLDQMGGAA